MCACVPLTTTTPPHRQMKRDSIHILGLSPGSIIANLEIHHDPNGMGLDPALVAANLSMQAQDPNSLLRRGTITAHTQVGGRLTRQGVRGGSGSCVPVLSLSLHLSVALSLRLSAAFASMPLSLAPQ